MDQKCVCSLLSVLKFLITASLHCVEKTSTTDRKDLGIALNSGDTTIADSYVSDIKGVGIDTQAIGGWNGSGPYRIHNNYLEAAGEVIMFGGDDPKIPSLVPSDIEVRGNTVSRPLSWRDPIIAPPASVVGVPAAGSLPAGTYGYRVVARRPAGSSATANSAPSAEVTVTLAAAGGVSLIYLVVGAIGSRGVQFDIMSVFWLLAGVGFCGWMLAQ